MRILILVTTLVFSVLANEVNAKLQDCPGESCEDAHCYSDGTQMAEERINDVPWNNPEVKAPYMMDLAANGVILDNYYAQPVCSPSRGALMTGKYPWRIGMQHDVIAISVPECAPRNEEFLPEKLKKAGYATHAVGKWHLGFCNVECTPTYRGFDTFFGFYQGFIDHFSHMVAGGHDWWDSVAGKGENSREDLKGIYAGDLINERAVEIINNHDPATPLFLYLPHSSVHFPIQAPERYSDMYPDLGETKAKYLGMISGIDDTVKEVTEALKAKGMFENSLIIFTSDNGADHKVGSNGNLRGSKGSLYEGGVKIPAFVLSPAITSPGRSNGLMHITDWHATILSLVGLDPSGLDGLDQSSMLFKGGPSIREEIILQTDSSFPQWFGAEAIRVSDYKLLKGYPGLKDGYGSDGTIGFTHQVNLMGVEHNNGRGNITKTQYDDPSGKYSFDWAAISNYIEFAANKVQLFNLADDPEERHNLAREEPDKVAELISKLDFAKRNEKLPDLKAQIPVPEASPSNLKGMWSPSWC